MPIYQFMCEQCGTRFEASMTIAEHGQNRPECPKCHSESRVYGEPAMFAAVTSRKT
jgi:putative FmdB family regulatory protein